jgi:hypothetical protein
MTYLRIAVLLAASALALMGCKHDQPTTDDSGHTRVAAAGAAGATTRPVIVRIVSRSETIVVTAGPKEPLYSVQDSSGRTLVAACTLAEMKATHPDLYQRIEPTLALDASVDGPRPARFNKSATGGATSDGRFLDASDARR